MEESQAPSYVPVGEEEERRKGTPLRDGEKKAISHLLFSNDNDSPDAHAFDKKSASPPTNTPVVSSGHSTTTTTQGADDKDLNDVLEDQHVPYVHCLDGLKQQVKMSGHQQPLASSGAEGAPAAPPPVPEVEAGSTEDKNRNNDVHITTTRTTNIKDGRSSPLQNMGSPTIGAKSSSSPTTPTSYKMNQESRTTPYVVAQSPAMLPPAATLGLPPRQTSSQSAASYKAAHPTIYEGENENLSDAGSGSTGAADGAEPEQKDQNNGRQQNNGGATSQSMNSGTMGAGGTSTQQGQNDGAGGAGSSWTSLGQNHVDDGSTMKQVRRQRSDDDIANASTMALTKGSCDSGSAAGWANVLHEGHPQTVDEGTREGSPLVQLSPAGGLVGMRSTSLDSAHMTIPDGSMGGVNKLLNTEPHYLLNSSPATSSSGNMHSVINSEPGGAANPATPTQTTQTANSSADRGAGGAPLSGSGSRAPAASVTSSQAGGSSTSIDGWSHASHVHSARHALREAIMSLQNVMQEASRALESAERSAVELATTSLDAPEELEAVANAAAMAKQAALLQRQAHQAAAVVKTTGLQRPSPASITGLQLVPTSSATLNGVVVPMPPTLPGGSLQPGNTGGKFEPQKLSEENIHAFMGSQRELPASALLDASRVRFVAAAGDEQARMNGTVRGQVEDEADGTNKGLIGEGGKGVVPQGDIPFAGCGESVSTMISSSTACPPQLGQARGSTGRHISTTSMLHSSDASYEASNTVLNVTPGVEDSLLVSSQSRCMTNQVSAPRLLSRTSSSPGGQSSGPAGALSGSTLGTLRRGGRGRSAAKVDDDDDSVFSVPAGGSLMAATAPRVNKPLPADMDTLGHDDMFLEEAGKTVMIPRLLSRASSGTRTYNAPSSVYSAGGANEAISRHASQESAQSVTLRNSDSGYEASWYVVNSRTGAVELRRHTSNYSVLSRQVSSPTVCDGDLTLSRNASCDSGEGGSTSGGIIGTNSTSFVPPHQNANMSVNTNMNGPLCLASLNGVGVRDSPSNAFPVVKMSSPERITASSSLGPVGSDFIGNNQQMLRKSPTANEHFDMQAATYNQAATSKGFEPYSRVVNDGAGSHSSSRSCLDATTASEGKIERTSAAYYLSGVNANKALSGGAGAGGPVQQLNNSSYCTPDASAAHPVDHNTLVETASSAASSGPRLPLPVGSSPDGTSLLPGGSSFPSSNGHGVNSQIQQQRAKGEMFLLPFFGSEADYGTVVETMLPGVVDEIVPSRRSDNDYDNISKSPSGIRSSAVSRSQTGSIETDSLLNGGGVANRNNSKSNPPPTVLGGQLQGVDEQKLIQRDNKGDNLNVSNNGVRNTSTGAVGSYNALLNAVVDHESASGRGVTPVGSVRVIPGRIALPQTPGGGDSISARRGKQGSEDSAIKDHQAAPLIIKQSSATSNTAVEQQRTQKVLPTSPTSSATSFFPNTSPSQHPSDVDSRARYRSKHGQSQLTSSSSGTVTTTASGPSVASSVSVRGRGPGQVSEPTATNASEVMAGSNRPPHLREYAPPPREPRNPTNAPQVKGIPSGAALRLVEAEGTSTTTSKVLQAMKRPQGPEYFENIMRDEAQEEEVRDIARRMADLMNIELYGLLPYPSSGESDCPDGDGSGLNSLQNERLPALREASLVQLQGGPPQLRDDQGSRDEGSSCGSRRTVGGDSQQPVSSSTAPGPESSSHRATTCSSTKVSSALPSFPPRSTGNDEDGPESDVSPAGHAPGSDETNQDQTDDTNMDRPGRSTASEVSDEGSAGTRSEQQKAGGSLYRNSVSSWLQPGRRWKGNICIPGDSRGTSGVDYYFNMCDRPWTRAPTFVLQEMSDNSIGGIFYALHSDDTDAQFVRVVVEDDTSDPNCAELFWHDFETECRGTLDYATGRIRGSVQQLRDSSEEGFYHPQKAGESSVFTLDPCVAEEDIRNQERNEKRTRYNVDCYRNQPPASLELERRKLLMEIVDIWANYCQEQAEPPTIPIAMSEAMPWAQLYETSFLFPKMLQTDFRDIREVLKYKVFYTLEEKRQWIRKINGTGPVSRTRLDAHKAWFECRNCVQVMLSKFSSFIPRPPSHRAEAKRIQTEDARLKRLFESIDLELRSLMVRVSQAELAAMKITIEEGSCFSASVNDAVSNLCAICYTDFDEDGEEADVLRFRCRHYFHYNCAEHWLRGKSQCPTCRCECAKPLDE
ncbi:unnamed protein product [Amoebophrya sp. A25]|nr:unnamed protein product [Amoebophrya sp. A25]|eukprot:GSA25T00011066001.1